MERKRTVKHIIVGGVRRMCMVVRKKQLITFIMTVLMFHLSFIAFKEEYFVGFLKIQRYAAIALIGLVFININAFIKKENCLINIILILLIRDGSLSAFSIAFSTSCSISLRAPEGVFSLA